LSAVVAYYHKETARNVKKKGGWLFATVAPFSISMASNVALGTESVPKVCREVVQLAKDI
jgi:hypothetical protein